MRLAMAGVLAVGSASALTDSPPLDSFVPRQPLSFDAVAAPIAAAPVTTRPVLLERLAEAEIGRALAEAQLDRIAREADGLAKRLGAVVAELARTEAARQAATARAEGLIAARDALLIASAQDRRAARNAARALADAEAQAARLGAEIATLRDQIERLTLALAD